MSLSFTTLRTWHLSITNAVNHSPTTFYHTTTKFILHSHHKVTTTLPILISIQQNKTNLTQPQNHSNKIITPPHTHKTITIKLTHTNTTNPKSNSFTISSCQIKTMSDPTTTALPHPSIIPNQHHNLPLLHGVTTTTQPPPPPPPPSSREYRKGNWTIQETLILITAKKLDDERRLKNTSTPSSSQDPNRTTTNVTSIASASSSSSNRNSGELRWKWVENYCWSNGCLRSQNQCNDKWDNLLRDYKKVRDYESKSESPNNNKLDFPSYWTLNKQQRKEQNLPSNMVFEVYQAISDVLQRKQSQRIIGNPQQQQNLVTLVSSSQQPPLLQAQPLPPLPPPLPLQQPPPPPHAPASSTTPVVSERSESSDSEQSEDNDDDDGSESKRRKVKNLGSSIMRSASVLARALRRCEEKKEKRHRELIELEQRRIQMEEARNEVHRQGIATLVAAVTNLSGAIQSFINSEHHGRR